MLTPEHDLPLLTLANEDDLPADYAVAATDSLAERLQRALKHGDTFGVFDASGDLVAHADSPEGIYHGDTRFLSRFELTLGGMRLLVLGSTLGDDNAVLTSDLTNPDLMHGDRVVVRADLVHVRRTRFLWNAHSHDRLAVRNFADVPLHLALVMRFAADFADLFEVRGMRRARRGSVHLPDVGPSEVALAYSGLDGEMRTTRLRFDPPPTRIRADAAVYALQLPPRGRVSIHVDVACERASAAPSRGQRFVPALREAHRAMRCVTHCGASLHSSNDIFNEVTRRAQVDLAMLMSDREGERYPYAGIPWYSTVFGRDGIITAYQMLWADPTMARGVLMFLARHQATASDAASDAEPGKILHEMRAGEMAALHEVPFGRYYGSVDATPLFVMLAGAYLERTDDVAALRTLWPHVEAALRWIDLYGDRDGDGFVEYARRTEQGLANQGWKDSHDAVFHADGTGATGAIALCEVQGYVFAARRAAALIARRLGDGPRALELDQAALTLQRRFEEAFWCEEIGSYALALDGAKQQCKVRTSNAGHALFSGIANAEHARRVAEQLMGFACFSGWGVRTVAAGEARYNPMSYHNGSVWPHDNGLIGLGFSRYGHTEAAARILEGLFAAATYMDLRRLPELVCGFPRRRGQGPTTYPVACSPQAWSAAAPVALVGAVLGMQIDPRQGRVRFEYPRLPNFLDELLLRGLQVGEATLDIRVLRHGDAVVVSAEGRRGRVEVNTIT